MDNVTAIKFFISSPKDATEERNAICEEIHRINRVYALSREIVIIPFTSDDMFSQTGNHPQTLVNRQLVESCDALIACFKYRFGTPTENYNSGTEEEIEIQRGLGNHVAVFFSSEVLGDDMSDPEQSALLKNYRESLSKTAFYEEFQDLADLRQRTLKNVMGYIENYLAINPTNIPKTSIASLFIEIQSNFAREFYSIKTNWNVLKESPNGNSWNQVGYQIKELLIDLGGKVESIMNGKPSAFIEDIESLAKEANQLATWIFTMGGSNGMDAFKARMNNLIVNLEHLKLEPWDTYIATSIPN